MRAPDADDGTPERDPMDFDLSKPTLARLKARAQDLRQSSNPSLSQAAALEQIARADGARDWNTRRALALRPVRLALGDRVRGRYLNHPFQARVLGLSRMGPATRITLRFDEAIDVVTFASFSAYRRQVQAVLGQDGRSLRGTSDGIPHLVLEAREG